MTVEKEKQIQRILSMYERLKKGDALVKKEEAARFQISEKSIQRDIDSIRTFVENGASEYITYDRGLKAYVYESEQPSSLTTEEIFAVLKVMIESRAFPKHEMDHIIENLTELARKEDQPLIKLMMSNEKHLYAELYHKKDLLERLWHLASAIHVKKVIDMTYKREHDEIGKKRKVKPVGLIFSEYYFYLIAYPVNKDYDYPTVYRVDRIERFELTSQTFKVPYHERFQEGEFRQRVQFMYTGELLRLKFRFTGSSPQAVLDRLPTAKIIARDETGVTIEAEVFGKGIQMWLLSQGRNVEVLEPKAFREEMEANVRNMLDQYAGVLQS